MNKQTVSRRKKPHCLPCTRVERRSFRKKKNCNAALGNSIVELMGVFYIYIYIYTSIVCDRNHVMYFIYLFFEPEKILDENALPFTRLPVERLPRSKHLVT